MLNLAALVIGAGFGLHCAHPDKPESTKPTAPAIPTLVSKERAATVTHDGHYFILMVSTYYHAGVLIHHPGCPCQKGDAR